MSEQIRVLIVDDMEPLQRRYCKCLTKDERITVVGCAGNGYESVMMAAVSHPDVILMDIEMESKWAGLDATQEILQELPNTKMIILTVSSDDSTVFKAFQLGVVDYLLKDASSTEVVDAVIDAYHGRSPIRPMIANKIRREFKRVKNSEVSLIMTLQISSQLTNTEMDILYLSQQGKTRAEICSIRHVELTTVKTQIHSILKKFNKKSISEVISMLEQINFFDVIQRVKQGKV
ncbi:MAG: response regulator transcription factor [Oscillospiraceae bacterium]|jgi:DNA-binding NarL/FixJ family response regulator|nr:response regulator transcription factor [Oscillospiraceae bacterium]MDD3261476.1 response regulator transcription factor [Oscillospiraceae bacterium]